MFKLPTLAQRHYRELDSTNSKLKELAESGAPDLTTVTADFQSAGRGRQGRTWQAPAGSSLLMSLLWRKSHPIASIAAGVAVAESVKQYIDTPEKVQLKWPNDVLIDGKKVCGILVEGRPSEPWLVVGIGINTCLDTAQLPEELRQSAVSMQLNRLEAVRFKATVVGNLVNELATPAENILEHFRALDYLQGKSVTHMGRTFKAAGIAESGNLIVTDEDGCSQELAAGEVHLTS